MKPNAALGTRIEQVMEIERASRRSEILSNLSIILSVIILVLTIVIDLELL